MILFQAVIQTIVTIVIWETFLWGLAKFARRHQNKPAKRRRIELTIFCTTCGRGPCRCEHLGRAKSA